MEGALKAWNISVCFSGDREESSSKTMAKGLLWLSPVSPQPSSKRCLSTYLPGTAVTKWSLGFCKYMYPVKIAEKDKHAIKHTVKPAKHEEATAVLKAI